MRCANCLHENRPTAYFCDNCGRTLEKTCPHCSTVNRPSANFCDHCGRAFTADPAPPPAAQSSTQIPLELVRKLELARDTHAMVGERRVVTMLFCDVTGSTAAAEQLDPEEWTEIINGAFEHMIAPVYRYEGTLARLMGDAILAFFGAPIAHEDDPQRAVLAGLDIIQEITPYWERIKARWGIDANVRVGINTGLVVVGAVGSDLKMEYTALGDAINLAARMEQTAEPGTVQVSEHTYRLAKPVFEWEPLGPLPLKGKEAPVHAYRPVRRLADPGRLRGIAGLDSPLVGRKREKDALLENLAALEKGRGGIVFVTGEAGLGKSRLVREVCLAWSAGAPEKAVPPVWIERRATSYDSMQAYSLLKRFLRRTCSIEDSSSPERVRERLAAWADGLPLPDEVRRELVAVLTRLFSGREAAGQEHPSEHEGFRARLFAVLGEWMQRFYARSPGVVFIDDMHWADSASLEMFEHLAGQTDQAALLFIFATRPEWDSAAWEFKSRLASAYPHRLTDVVIPPLTVEEGDSLLTGLLENADLPENFHAVIRSKSDGNPFFIEELVRGFIESGILSQKDGRWHVRRELEEHVVPDNIEALLAARIDRLNPAAKQTLQIASVIGRNFNFPVLAQVSSLGQELEPVLEELLRSRMVEETARLPVREYVFRQALTQETAYRSILLRQRKNYHREVGSAVEHLYPDQLESFASMLAHHFQEAGEHLEAARYHRIAGDNAFALYASREATEHYGSALELAAKDGRGGSEDIKALFLRRGRSFELLSEFEKALETYQDMERWGVQHGDRSIELGAIVSQAVLRSTPTALYDFELGSPLIEKAMQIAGEIGDAGAEARAHWAKLNLLRLVSNNRKAAEAGLRGLEIAREHGLTEQLAYIYHDLGYVYAELGDIERSLDAFRKAGAIWEEIGNLPHLADGLVGGTLDLMMRGEFDQAIIDTEKAQQISQKTHNIWGRSFSKMYLGTIYRELGRYAEALEAADSSIRDSRIAGFAVPEPLCTMQKIYIYSDLGDTDTAIMHARHLWDVASEHQVQDIRSLGFFARLFILLESGQIEEAKRFYDTLNTIGEVNENLLFVFGGNEQINLQLKLGEVDKAYEICMENIRIASELTIYSVLPDLRMTQAEILNQRDPGADPRPLLLQALEEARSINKRRITWQILGRLYEHELARGDPVLAEHYRTEAAEIVHIIAAHAPDSLRAGFLARPDVRAIIGAEALKP